MAGRSLSIARGVSQRSRRKMVKNPVGSLPPILIPLFMFAAFTGALSSLAATDSFDYYDFTAFQFLRLTSRYPSHSAPPGSRMNATSDSRSAPQRSPPA